MALDGETTVHAGLLQASLAPENGSKTLKYRAAASAGELQKNIDTLSKMQPNNG